VAAFHHHNDGGDHPDCPICLNTHQQSNAELKTSFCLIYPDFKGIALFIKPRLFASKAVFTPANNRAPPA
jgi:hypothetical protein